MRALRRLLQYIFGLQGLILLATVPGLVAFLYLFLTKDAPAIHQRALRLILGDGIACLINAVCAITWWKLRRQRPDARRWAIAASILALPIPIPGLPNYQSLLAHASHGFAFMLHIPPELLDCAIGLAGLIVFLRPDREPAAPIEPKPARVEGDGTNRLWDYAFKILAGGGTIATMFAWDRYALSHDLESPTAVPGIALVCLASFITIVGHELGHLLCGWLVGKKLVQFHAGPFLWKIRNGRWKFDFNWKRIDGGSVGMAAVNLTHLRSDDAIMIAGGPLASLLLGCACLLPLLAWPDGASGLSWFLLWMTAGISLMTFVANLIPQRTEYFYSDGAQLYQVITNGPWYKLHLAFGMASASLTTSARPRDWDAALLHDVAAAFPKGREGFFAQFYLGYCYFDSGDLNQGLRHIRLAECLVSDKMLRNAPAFYSELTFFNALYARDLTAAELWWSKLQALPKTDLDADYWKGRAALLWLRGDPQNARLTWERGEALARTLPPYGVYDFTRDQFEELREALRAPAAQTV